MARLLVSVACKNCSLQSNANYTQCRHGPLDRQVSVPKNPIPPISELISSPVSHIIRALNNQSFETVEVTGPQMVLTMKLTTFAWNVFDGRRPTDVRP